MWAICSCWHNNMILYVDTLGEDHYKPFLITKKKNYTPKIAKIQQEKFKGHAKNNEVNVWQNGHER